MTCVAWLCIHQWHGNWLHWPCILISELNFCIFLCSEMPLVYLCCADTSKQTSPTVPNCDNRFKCRQFNSISHGWTGWGLTCAFMSSGMWHVVAGLLLFFLGVFVEVSLLGPIRPWRWRQYFLSKRQETPKDAASHPVRPESSAVPL